MLRNFFIFVCSVVVLGAILGGALFYDAFLMRPAADAAPVVVTVEEGASVGEIAKELKSEGLLTSPFFFKAYAKLSDNQANLKAGRFELVPGMSLRALTNALTDVKAQEIQVTIPEGFTVIQIGDVIREALPEISEASWKEAVGASGVRFLTASDVTAGIPQGQGLEGYLFPDTYRFRVDTDARTVVETMYSTLLRRLAENGITVPSVLEKLEFDNGLTLHEVLTLASIIEREVRSPEDMKLVAGIFFTRLKIGMALQADSTINYVTGKRDAAVTVEDSKTDSPYNTYQRVGLPPGPISDPGMNAIVSVMQPQESDYLYFLTTSDGKVMYAKTFNEHVVNKRAHLY